MMKEFRVQVRIRNNRLIRLREDTGLSAPAFAEKIGVAYSHYIRLESLKMSPLDLQNQWRPICLRLAEVHGLGLDYLFPEVLKAVVKSSVERETSAEELAPLLLPEGSPEEMLSPAESYDTAELSHQITKCLVSLNPREQEIVSLRFGLGTDKDHTLEEVGEKFGLTSERVRQIEAKALRKLRHPSRSKRLRPFVAPPNPQSGG